MRAMHQRVGSQIKREEIGYVSIHADDCDAAFQYAEDAEFWMYATNELFMCFLIASLRDCSAEWLIVKWIPPYSTPQISGSRQSGDRAI